MEDNSKPFKRKRRLTGEDSSESRRPTSPQRIPDWNPFGQNESRSLQLSLPQSVGTSTSNESVPLWGPFVSDTRQSQQMRERRPVSAAMGSLQQGFDAPPIDEHIPIWDPFQEDDQEDDSAQDPFIIKMREQFKKKSEKHLRSGPAFPHSLRYNLKDVQKSMREQGKKNKRKILELKLRGFYKKGKTYQPLQEIHKKFDVNQRTTLFPQRRRSLDQIKCEAIKVSKRRRSRSPTRVLWDPNQERSRRLLARSKSTLAQLRHRDPDLYRRQMRRNDRKDMWKGLSHRKVYQKSPYKVFDANREVARGMLAGKRSNLEKGLTTAPKLIHQVPNVVPTLKHRLKKIREKTREPPLTAYFPQHFVGYPSRMRENLRNDSQIYSRIGSEMSDSNPQSVDSSQNQYYDQFEQIQGVDQNLSAWTDPQMDFNLLYPQIELNVEDSPLSHSFERNDETDDDSDIE